MYNHKALQLLASVALLIPSSAVVRAQTCSAECTAANRDTTEDFTITYTGRCKPDKFREKVTSTSDHACLVCLYNHAKGTALTEIDDVVTDLCVEGYGAYQYPFADITGKGAQFDNEHYAGGGEWNYEVETAAGEDRLKVDAARVDDVYYYQAQRRIIEFPTDTIESFNPFTSNVVEGVQDLDGCDLNAAYCCFAQDRQAGDNNGNCATPYEYNCVDKDPADNTNICLVDHTRSTKANHVSAGFSLYGDLKRGRENIEGSVHCHGFAWGEDPLDVDNVYKGNLLFYVSMYDHLTQRGYARNIPGSPMCACAENMAVVSRADCTQVSVSEKSHFKWNAATNLVEASIETIDVNYNACTGLNANNNLRERVRKLHSAGKVSGDKKNAVDKILVGSEAGNCNTAIEGFLATKNITRYDGTTATS
jgi:hypothetical protein